MINKWESSSSRISLCCVGLPGRSSVEDATIVMVWVEVTFASSEEKSEVVDVKLESTEGETCFAKKYSARNSV